MEELAVITSADLVDWGGVEIDKDGARDVFAAASLSEDGIELSGVVEGLCVGVRTTILLEAMLEQVPAGRMSFQRRSSMYMERALTAPMRCFQAGYRPGRCGGEESGERINISRCAPRIRTRP